MDCHAFEARLEALMEDSLSAAERLQCSGHLEACPHCRELAQLAAATSGTALDAENQALLLAAVLKTTSGPGCDRVAELLAASFDEVMEPVDAALVDQHQAGCSACQRLAVVLALLPRELPRLAEVPTDPRLVDRVLAATLPAAARWRRWWGATWPAWLQRPRFAMEIAFIATVLVALVLQTAGSPLQALPASALQVTHRAVVAGFAERVAAVRQRTAADARAHLGVPARSTIDAGRRLARRAWRSGKAELETIWQRAASSWQGRAKPITATR